MPEEPIEFADIQKQVEDIKKTLGDLKHILDQLNKPRSVVCKIINNTDHVLVLTHHQHDNGGFASIPPTVINARSAAAFGSQSSSGSLFTGTVGSVHYSGGGMLLKCDWNNPWLGSNSCELEWERDDGTGQDDNTGRYRTWHIAGGGDQQAEMVFVVSLVPEQYAWRFCRNCNVLFYDGYPLKGACAAPPPRGTNIFNPGRVETTLYRPVPYGSSLFIPGSIDPQIGGAYTTQTVPQVSPPKKRQHEAAGWIFILSHGWPPLGYQQAGWRFCHKCSSLFFDGYTDNKGVCPNGAGHEAAGFQFILTSNTAPPWIQSQQPGWKCCQKCFALFFDGYEDNKGLCPASGRHEPAEDWHLILNHHQ